MIIGELINSSRKAMKPLLEARDAEAVIAIARAEADAGADYIDLNCGAFLNNETEMLAWLTEIVAGNVDKPLCLDSPSPQALQAALAHTQGRVIINSISMEEQRYRDILPLAREYQTKLIALTMADDDIPKSADDRYDISCRLLDSLTGAGIALEDIYIDPLVQPLSVTAEGAMPIFETVRRLRVAYPGVHTVCGLSNISFGLPNRKLINRYFLAQAIAAGMDSFILDPTDRDLMGAYFAARALAGEDRFCAAYLKAHRKGLFES